MQNVGTSSGVPDGNQNPLDSQIGGSGKGKAAAFSPTELESGMNRLRLNDEVEQSNGEDFCKYFDRDYPPEIWISRPCVLIPQLPLHISEQDVKELFGEKAVTSIAFDEFHSAVIRLEKSYKRFIEPLLYRPQQFAVGNCRLQCSIFSHDSGLPLFVGNIPEESDDDSLLKLFDHHGQIDRAFIVRDADGRSKGFGFVEYCLESAMREAENDISRYSRLGLFVERAMVRDFHISQAVSLAVLELPIRSLQEARRTLFDLFRHYGKILGHYVDLQRCQAFVDFSVSQEADSGRRIRVFFSCPGRKAVIRRKENQLAARMEQTIQLRRDLLTLTGPLAANVLLPPRITPYRPTVYSHVVRLPPIFSPNQRLGMRPPGTGFYNPARPQRRLPPLAAPSSQAQGRQVEETQLPVADCLGLPRFIVHEGDGDNN